MARIGQLVAPGLSVLLFAIATDMYVPTLHDVARDLSATQHQLQLTLSGFVWTLALGQLLLGPVCDRVGRKPTMRVAGGIYILGALIGTAAHQFSTLLLARLLLAIGGSGAVVGALALVRDALADKSQAIKRYSAVTSVIALAPLLGPISGSYLTHYAGWRAVFVVLAILGGLQLILVHVCLRDDKPPSTQLNFGTVFCLYRQILTEPRFNWFALSAAVGFAGFFCFISASLYIFVDLLGLSRLSFGYATASIGVIFFAANGLTVPLARYLRSHQLVLISISMLGLIGVIFMLFPVHEHSEIVFVLLALMGAVCALSISAGAAGCTQVLPRYSGTVAALLGAFELGLAGLSSYIVMFWPFKSLHVLGCVYLLMAASVWLMAGFYVWRGRVF